MISEWLRMRMIRWLAKGGTGVTLVVEGAWHVTVASAGQVSVTGGQVMARGCQVLQDSTGREIDADQEVSRTEPERFMDEVDAAKEVATEAATGSKRKPSRTAAAVALAETTEALARLEGPALAVETVETPPAGKKPARKRAAKAPAALPAPAATPAAPAGKEPVAAPAAAPVVPVAAAQAAQPRQEGKPAGTALAVRTPMPKPLVAGSILGTPGGNSGGAWAKHNAADKRQSGQAKH